LVEVRKRFGGWRKEEGSEEKRRKVLVEVEREVR
jgi:hypothetical protein